MSHNLLGCHTSTPDKRVFYLPFAWSGPVRDTGRQGAVGSLRGDWRDQIRAWREGAARRVQSFSLPLTISSQGFERAKRTPGTEVKYIATNVPAGEDPVVEAGDVLYFSVYIQNKATLRYVVLNDMLYLSKLLYLRLHTLCITLYKRYPRLIYLRSNLPYKYIMSYYASIFYTTNILYFPIIIRNKKIYCGN